MLDLRTENKDPYIKKSQSLTLENVLDFVRKNSPTKDMAIVVVCEDGAVSTQAAEIISKDGYINVVVLEGGTKTLTAQKFL